MLGIIRIFRFRKLISFLKWGRKMSSEIFRFLWGLVVNVVLNSYIRLNALETDLILDKGFILLLVYIVYITFAIE